MGNDGHTAPPHRTTTHGHRTYNGTQYLYNKRVMTMHTDRRKNTHVIGVKVSASRARESTRACCAAHMHHVSPERQPVRFWLNLMLALVTIFGLNEEPEEKKTRKNMNIDIDMRARAPRNRLLHQTNIDSIHACVHKVHRSGPQFKWLNASPAHMSITISVSLSLSLTHFGCCLCLI